MNVILLLVASACWAGGYLFISWADKALTPLQVTAGQTIFGAIAVLIYAIRTHRPLLTTLRKKPWLPVVAALTAVALPNLSTSIAEEKVPAAMAALIGTTVPILTMLLAIFVTRQEQYAHRKVLGVLVAVSGMVVFVGLEALSAQEAELTHAAIMMAGGAVFAVNGILISTVGKNLDTPALAFWLLLFAGIVLSIWAVTTQGVPHWPGTSAMLSLAASGLISTGLAFLAYFTLIDRAGPAYAARYAYLVPPLGFVLGVAFSGEKVTPSHIAGIALTLAGLWLLSTRRAKAASPSEAVE